jgi:hypothetical protein
MMEVSLMPAAMQQDRDVSLANLAGVSYPVSPRLWQRIGEQGRSILSQYNKLVEVSKSSELEQTNKISQVRSQLCRLQHTVRSIASVLNIDLDAYLRWIVENILLARKSSASETIWDQVCSGNARFEEAQGDLSKPNWSRTVERLLILPDLARGITHIAIARERAQMGMCLGHCLFVIVQGSYSLGVNPFADFNRAQLYWERVNESGKVH